MPTARPPPVRKVSGSGQPPRPPQPQQPVAATPSKVTLQQAADLLPGTISTGPRRASVAPFSHPTGAHARFMGPSPAGMGGYVSTEREGRRGANGRGRRQRGRPSSETESGEDDWAAEPVEALPAEDFDFDAEGGVYTYPCPCGDKFQVTQVRARPAPRGVPNTRPGPRTSSGTARRLPGAPAARS